MKKQIILLAISILGAFSLHAQEINEGLVQSKQELSHNHVRARTGINNLSVTFLQVQA